MKNLIVMGLIVSIFLLATPASVFAGQKDFQENNGKNNSKTYSKNYGQEDEGDNAHPSGKDRSVEKGFSYPQGKSKSDPDNNGKGPDRLNTGLDKPGMGGGVDKEDQDGNNGCGNDDDFEDDNEGWCGKKPKVTEPTCENGQKSEKECNPTCENGGLTGSECEVPCENCGGTPKESEEPKNPQVKGIASLPITGILGSDLPEITQARLITAALIAGLVMIVVGLVLMFVSARINKTLDN